MGWNARSTAKVTPGRGDYFRGAGKEDLTRNPRKYWERPSINKTQHTRSKTNQLNERGRLAHWGLIQRRVAEAPRGEKPRKRREGNLEEKGKNQNAGEGGTKR